MYNSLLTSARIVVSNTLVAVFKIDSYQSEGNQDENAVHFCMINFSNITKLFKHIQGSSETLKPHYT